MGCVKKKKKRKKNKDDVEDQRWEATCPRSADFLETDLRVLTSNPQFEIFSLISLQSMESLCSQTAEMYAPSVRYSLHKVARIPLKALKKVLLLIVKI